jgi:signal transduction histidine kinase
LRRIIILANVLVAILLAGVIAAQSVADRRQVVEAAYADAENLTDALAEHTRQTLVALDLTTRTVADSIVPLARLDLTDPEAVRAILSNRQTRSPTTKAIFVIDPNGRVLANPDQFLSAIADPSALPEFEQHQTGDGDRLIIGPPRQSGLGAGRDRWYVNVTRRIDNPDGSFGGVAGAALSIDYLLAFYDALRLGKGGAVGLFTTDGILIARSPFDEQFIGRDLSGGVLFGRLHTGGDRGRFTAPYTTDGGVRLTAYRRAANDRAVVYVGLSEIEVLAPWRARLLFRGALGLLAMALFAGGSALVLRHTQRQRAWSERQSERLSLLASEAARLAQARDTTTAIDALATAARRLTGARRVVTRLTRMPGDMEQVRATVTADGYAAWRDYRHERDEATIQRLTEERGRPVILTAKDLQSELEGHAGTGDEAPPPRHNVLAVPIMSVDGATLGIIQLCDKEAGAFTADDASEILQLASTTGAVIERLQAFAALQTALAETRARKAEIDTIFSSISDAVYALDDDWRVVYMNEEAERQLQRPRETLMGRVLWDQFAGIEDTPIYGEYHRARREGQPVSFEFFYPPMKAWFAVRGFPHEQGLTAYFHDITRRVETDERLRQSQKMDVIGQLTGGVAHDFNNLLTVILGHAEDLVEYLAAAPPEVREEAAAILAAGERAAELTHRLLAFARRQPLRPRTTAVDELVAGMEGLMRRTLGENINIQIMATDDLWEAVVDPGELENALLNIAINARDAMPEGGRLTIETSNVVVDEAYAAENQIDPGAYIVLAVSDTGAGMSPETLSRVFDPFFTTKPQGKGSGLGLSMVYGFARQTGGHVKIYSEPGQGTTVRLYIPRAAADAVAEEPPPAPAVVPRGTERILVVEDDEPVRHHTVASLRALGYAVEACANGPEALTLLDAGASFDLLLTDVVLSDTMSGKAVAEAAGKRLPGLKILFMSGYTANAIVHHGRLDEGVMLLSKPFRRADLAQKVREAIDA